MEENNCLCLPMKPLCCGFILYWCYMDVSNVALSFFAFIIITTNEKKRVKYVIIKYAESPIYIRREQEKAFKTQPLNENNIKIMGTVIRY